MIGILVSSINKGTRKETIHFLHTYHHWTMREILAWVCLVWIYLVSAGIFPLHLLRHFPPLFSSPSLSHLIHKCWTCKGTKHYNLTTHLWNNEFRAGMYTFQLHVCSISYLCCTLGINHREMGTFRQSTGWESSSKRHYRGVYQYELS